MATRPTSISKQISSKIIFVCLGAYLLGSFSLQADTANEILTPFDIRLPANSKAAGKNYFVSGTGYEATKKHFYYLFLNNHNIKPDLGELNLPQVRTLNYTNVGKDAKFKSMQIHLNVRKSLTEIFFEEIQPVLQEENFLQ